MLNLKQRFRTERVSVIRDLGAVKKKTLGGFIETTPDRLGGKFRED